MALTPEDRAELEEVLAASVTKGMATFRSNVDEEEAKKAAAAAEEAAKNPPKPVDKPKVDFAGYLLGRRGE